MLLLFLSVLIFLAWIYLVFLHGRFWDAQVTPPVEELEKWPSVVAVVPARNESETIQEVVRGILGQNYPGPLSLIVVDDHSEDKTGYLAFLASQQISKADRLTVLTGQPLPQGWAGKVWAMHQGWEEAGKTAPDYIWFTDADIWHEPEALRRLVARSVRDNLGLNSAMVQLRCEGFWEKLLVPAFVYFFKLLYPFAWVRESQRKTAGAAGGSMLARSDCLGAVKGPSAIKGALIDDCALAHTIQKAGGSLRLELTRDSLSLRGYPDAADAWNTIARTAYTQLHYNPWLLAGSVLGLGLLFLLPALGVVATLLHLSMLVFWQDSIFPNGFSLSLLFLNLAWALMTASFEPIVRFYRLGPQWGLALPFITCFYLGATIASARRYYAGSGGRWKGRTVDR